MLLRQLSPKSALVALLSASCLMATSAGPAGAVTVTTRSHHGPAAGSTPARVAEARDRALAVRIADQVQSKGLELAKLAERADAAGVVVSSLQARLRRATRAAGGAARELAGAKSALADEALAAYTQQGAQPPAGSPGALTVAGQVVSGYAEAVLDEQRQVLADYGADLARNRAAVRSLSRARASAEVARGRLMVDRRAAAAQQAALSRELAKVRGRLASEVAAVQAQRQAEQQAIEKAYLVRTGQLPATNGTATPTHPGGRTPALRAAPHISAGPGSFAGTAQVVVSAAARSTSRAGAPTTQSPTSTAPATPVVAVPTASTTSTTVPTTTTVPTYAPVTLSTATTSSTTTTTTTAPAATTTAPAATTTAPAATTTAPAATTTTAPAATTTEPAATTGPGGTTSTTSPLLPPTGPASNAPAAGWQVALAFAESQIGKPYKWAGAGPTSYDCSGLTMVSWSHAGVPLPHSAQYQYDMTKRVAIRDLRPGDLVFFGTPKSVYHVGIYIGNGEMVDAPDTGQDVKVQSIFELHLLGGGRV